MAVRTVQVETLFGPHGSDWRMSLGERAALEGILASLQPAVSVEIGTFRGGSLERISAHSEVVHSFDRAFEPSVTQSRFPNVVFHEGNSHETLPPALDELVRTGASVDFAFVDGDHSAGGVRQDVQDLLDSPSVSHTIIVIHDTLNERVRAGLRDVELGEKPTYVELDFVVGQVWGGGGFDHDLWGGLGLIVTGWELGSTTRGSKAPLYDAVDVFSTFRKTIAAGGGVEHAHYGEIHRLERAVVDARTAVRLMERSLSWRLTAPLRQARTLLRR